MASNHKTLILDKIALEITKIPNNGKNLTEEQLLEWYKNWIIQQGFPIEEDFEYQYNNVAEKILSDFQKMTFWKEFIDNYENYNSDYRKRTNYELFAHKEKPVLVIKPVNSFLLKTFRKNILNNPKFLNNETIPDGFILPNNWYSKIHDIIRTMIVVKYLDGVEEIIAILQEISKKNSGEISQFKCDYEARTEGYYAAHINIEQNIEIKHPLQGTIKVPITIEIQVTTQIQEIIRTLLHEYYEENRIKMDDSTSVDWHWKYGTPEFSVNYLGHILHYIEGVIIEVRDKKGEFNE